MATALVQTNPTKLSDLVCFMDRSRAYARESKAPEYSPGISRRLEAFRRLASKISGSTTPPGARHDSPWICSGAGHTADSVQAHESNHNTNEKCCCCPIFAAAKCDLSATFGFLCLEKSQRQLIRKPSIQKTSPTAVGRSNSNPAAGTQRERVRRSPSPVALLDCWSANLTYICGAVRRPVLGDDSETMKTKPKVLPGD